MTRCPVCSDSLAPEAPAAWCEACGLPHHPECWSYVGRCSSYGCGGDRQGPRPPAPGAGLPVVIGEGDPVRVAPGGGFTGLARWAAKRAAGWTTTIPAGVVGSALVLLGMPLAGIGMPDVEAILTFMAVGVIHGLVAPFLAPVQHRRPWTTGGGALLVVAATAVALAKRLPGDGLERLIPLSIWISGTAIACASFADGVLGPRSRLGVRYGTFHPMTRAGVAFLAGMAAWYGFTVLVGTRIGGPSELLSIALLSLMGTALGFPALERGKALYLESLPPERR